MGLLGNSPHTHYAASISGNEDFFLVWTGGCWPRAVTIEGLLISECCDVGGFLA